MISTHGLRYSYAGASHALHFPDIEVAQGHVLLLRGPSGSGKSTWLALVAGLVAPTSGSMEVSGQVLHGVGQMASDAWRAKTIGFLPQKLHLSAALSVYQNLALAFWAAGVAEDGVRIKSVLNALGVAELANRLPSQLSGGQAQRVALARAVLMQPKVLLADEPTASLDDNAATDAVTLLLKTANANGATLVIATHDARVEAVINQQSLLGATQSVQRLNLAGSSPEVSV
ncbi:MAG: ATP-binding cassette domain-containing protein [Comamonadaceae bacterium]|nr:MAG: ATP-binding cassette domain-containing protein [Comamonadaceae bacterium]